MKLKKLLIQGFKSFKDRTVIQFDEGITGIVGPNGCGKSNIVDALFWVMGEQSAKHLRGNSMKDVIFAGSEKYSPAAFAEVTLVLENSGGKSVHVGDKLVSPSEIHLTRKLYRNGETEYRLNNCLCRLRDIQEVFMDTGVGAKSYSIIAQGEINRLVQAGPQEKRIMIEEVAGITKFKLRKKESLKKMELTQQNLGRLQDLKSEIAKRLKQLEGQAEKAEKAKTLREKIERHELTVESHRELEWLQKYREYQEQLQKFTVELEEARVLKNRSEIELQEQKLRQGELLQQVDEKQRLYNERARELAKGEERYRFLQQSRQERIKLVEAREKENQELLQDSKILGEKIKVWQGELDTLSSDKPEDSELELFQEKLSILKEEVEYKETTLKELRQELEVGRNRLRQLEQQQLKNQSQVQDDASRLEEIGERLDWLEGEMSNRSQNLVLEQLAQQEFKKRQEILDVKSGEVSTKLTQVVERSKQDQKVLKELTLAEAYAKSRLRVLQEWSVVDRSDQPELLDYLKTEQGQSYRFLAEILESNIGSDLSMAKGIQRLLENYLTSLVSKKSGEGEETLLGNVGHFGFSYLTSTTTDLATSARADLSYLGLRSLSELTKVSDEYDFLNPLFMTSWIADEFSPELWGKLKNISGVWSVSDSKGTFHARSQGEGVVQTLTLFAIDEKSEEKGILVRQQEKKQLEEEIVVLQQKISSLQATSSGSEQELQTLRGEREKILQELSEIKAQLQVKKSHISQIEEALAKETQRATQFKARKEELSRSRLGNLEQEESLAQALEQQEQLVTDKQSIVLEVEEEWQIKRSMFEELREEVLERETYLKTYEIRFKTLSTQLEDAIERLEKQEERSEHNEELIAEYNKEIVDGLILLEKLKEVNQELAVGMASEEKQLKEEKRNLENLQNSVTNLEKVLRGANTTISKNEREDLFLKTKMEQIVIEEEQCVRNIFEKYQVNVRLVVGAHLEITAEELSSTFKNVDNMYMMEDEQGWKELKDRPFAFSRKYGQELQNITQNWRRYQRELVQLGEINWMAVEEYQQQKKRHDFLLEQEAQLEQSLADLNNAIFHINEKSKERFKNAFESVQEHFSFVFPILFGGGSAKLELFGSFEDVDAGVEIVASPPGKKMQNINLMSGGEKALTAVSLIFATFMVRPSPFCLLDEVDAPLDDANVTRFNNLLKSMGRDSQFILITHNKKTMELNDMLYGVTMEEPGVSKAVSVRLQ